MFLKYIADSHARWIYRFHMSKRKSNFYITYSINAPKEKLQETIAYTWNEMNNIIDHTNFRRNVQNKVSFSFNLK